MQTLKKHYYHRGPGLRQGRQYVVLVCRDLLGAWNVCRFYGNRRAIQVHACFKDAMTQLHEIEKVRLKHGYQEIA